jgi:uncharacterized membrane protein YeiB
MNQRIIGIDVARALAIIGMIIVNFKMVFGHHSYPWLYSISSVFDGKAAATFVVLAGVGIAFATKNANQDIRFKTHKILKRALILFLLGISYIVIWPADILHFYGIYIPITIFFIRKKPNTILFSALGLIFLYPILMVFLDYESFWNFEQLEYQQFWTIKGFLYHLFYNGFHPVIPWVSFMLLGLWWGKKSLHSPSFIIKSIKVSAGIFLAIQLISYILITLFANGDGVLMEDIKIILGTAPMPPLPLYMISGGAIAICIISICIYFSNIFKDHKITIALAQTGKLALTFYVAHVILGMGIIEVLYPNSLGSYTIVFSLNYAVTFSFLCMLFASLWLKHFNSGPLEWLIQKIIS